MSGEQVFNEMEAVFREVFSDDGFTLTPQTSARDVEDWDSLMHLQLVTAMEKRFKTRFTLGEIQNFKNVGDMHDCLIRHLS